MSASVTVNRCNRRRVDVRTSLIYVQVSSHCFWRAGV